MTTLPNKDTNMPHSAENMPHSQPPVPPDPMEEGRRLLAQIHAEVQAGEEALARTMHEGAEHFRGGMEGATKGLQDADLDGWSHQAASLARVGSAAGRGRSPVEKKS